MPQIPFITGVADSPFGVSLACFGGDEGTFRVFSAFFALLRVFPELSAMPMSTAFVDIHIRLTLARVRNNNKQQTPNTKHQTPNNKQQTTNNKQQTTNNKQQTTTTTTTTTNNNNKPFPTRVPTFSCVAWWKQLQLLIMEVDKASAARRRRERRPRQFLRHERLNVAMALSEKKHHTSRGQRKDRAGRRGSRRSSRPSSGCTHPPAGALPAVRGRARRFPATLSG